jgi:hypothetical protein
LLASGFQNTPIELAFMNTFLGPAFARYRATSMFGMLRSSKLKEASEKISPVEKGTNWAPASQSSTLNDADSRWKETSVTLLLIRKFNEFLDELNYE